LRNIQKKSFDLVFLDIWTPKLTGLEVLARVRAGESRPKIIIMTADGTPETLLRAIREQAYEYLSKPFPPKRRLKWPREHSNKALLRRSKSFLPGPIGWSCLFRARARLPNAFNPF
jgi:DNA-binding NtrC family response regulator